MNIQEIISYVTNSTTTIQQKGEYLEWQLFDWLNANGFTPSKTTYQDHFGNIKGDGGIDLFATRLINNQRTNFVIQCKCYVSPHSRINDIVIQKLINRAEQYNSYGILFCYDLSRLSEKAIQIINEHPKILMFDINNVQEMITRLSELIPINSTLNDQLIITKPVKCWLRIESVDQIEIPSNSTFPISIKASGISGLEFKSF
jgi:hypothetical protein